MSTPSYPKLPARMREVGVIKSNVYGVYLNDFRESWINKLLLTL